MTTLKEIADKCDVSTSTVSLVLNKPYKISKDVRKKVYDSIIQMGYFKEKNQAIKQIGIVFDSFYKDFFGDFYSEVIYGILQKSSNLNFNIRILTDLNVDYYDIHDIQGLIFVGKTPNEFYEKVKQFRIPFINCGHPNYHHMEVPTAYLSRTLNTKNLVQFVMNCGHQNIAVIVGENDPKDIIRREFLDAIIEVKPDLDQSLIFEASYDEMQTVEIVWNKIMSHTPKITAVMCGNDLLAYYVYNCAKKYNIRIPDDISVTGFDGIHFPKFTNKPTPKLTTVYGNRIELGQRSIELIYSVLKGIPVEDKLILSHGNLVIGDSVSRI